MQATDLVHSPTPEELMAFLDGETPADARAAIETHVGACVQCRGVISELRGVNSAMSAWDPEPAPAVHFPRVVRVKGWSLPALSWRPSYLVLSIAGGAATVVLVVGLGTYTKRAGALPPGLPVTEPLTVMRADHASAVNAPLDGRLDRDGSLAKDAFGTAPGFAQRAGGGGGGRPEPERRAMVQAGPLKSAPPSTAAAQTVAPRQPSVIRTATLQLVATDFNAARASVEAIVAQAGGFLDQITVNGAPGSARTLTGTLRVPATRLNEALATLRQLGQVTEDTQGSEDVTDQLVDLDARLANARATEQRLTEILKNRTGKLSDVLEVEQEVSRVRLEIEQMDAQRLNTGRRVTYATITLQIDEIRKAGLESGPLSLATRLRVAAADGLESALESLVGTVLFVLRAGPATMIWAIVAFSVWIVVRRFRRAGSSA